MQWIESNGGPLVVVPCEHIDQWSGVQGDSEEGWSDYDLACSVNDEVGIVQKGGFDVLVLGDEPLRTTWLSDADGGRLVRWVYADDEHAVFDISSSNETGIGNVLFRVQGPCTMFDAADAGRAIRSNHLTLYLDAGTYVVTSWAAEPDPGARFLVHGLRRVST